MARQITGLSSTTKIRFATKSDYGAAHETVQSVSNGMPKSVIGLPPGAQPPLQFIPGRGRRRSELLRTEAYTIYSDPCRDEYQTRILPCQYGGKYRYRFWEEDRLSSITLKDTLGGRAGPTADTGSGSRQSCESSGDDLRFCRDSYSFHCIHQFSIESLA